MPNATTKILIVPRRPSGAVETHALDCRWARSISKFASSGNAQQGYEEVDVARIPPGTGRCAHCGGGR